MYYEVIVCDRQTSMEVTVGQALSKAEALKLRNAISSFNACTVIIKEFTWFNKKGKILK